MTLEEVRRFFAEEIQYFANVKNPALVAAFARVPREKFVGPGPWKIGLTSFTETCDADARHVYHNLPIALDESRNLNNGQPGSLAAWIDALELKSGERVFHLGGGVGYYDAILAEVVGSTGMVMVAEVDADLAVRARENLTNYPNVVVHAADGAEVDPGPCDAILLRDPEIETNLRKAIGMGLMGKLQSIRRDPHEPANTCVLHRRDVCLSTVGLAERTGRPN